MKAAKTMDRNLKNVEKVNKYSVKMMIPVPIFGLKFVKILKSRNAIRFIQRVHKIRFKFII